MRLFNTPVQVDPGVLLASTLPIVGNLSAP